MFDKREKWMSLAFKIKLLDTLTSLFLVHKICLIVSKFEIMHNEEN